MDDSNFFSVDRLIEFGIGMSVAQQMVGSMNKAMTEMQMPGGLHQVMTPPPYHVAIDGSNVGPLSACELSQLIKAKKVDKNTLAWMPGMSGWKPIEQVPAILKIIALTPPPLNI